MSDLFPDLPPVLSPRLQWMQEHDVNVCLSLADGEVDELSGNEGPLWAAWYGQFPETSAERSKAVNESRMALCESESAAIERLAQKNDWKLWNAP